jgi:hypothetical protein
MTAGPYATERNRRLGVGQLIEDSLTVFKEGLSFEAQGELARRAQQQLDAEARLERVETAPDHGGGNGFHPGCRRETAASRRFDEGANLLEMIHEPDYIPEVKDDLILIALLFQCRV